MLRRALTIISLIGLLLSVGLWGVSYWNAIFGLGYFSGALSRGVVELSYQLTRHPSYSSPQQGHWFFEGFDAWYTSLRPYGWVDETHAYLSLPLWMPTTLFLMMCWFSYLPLHRRRKRKKLGLCLKCGYDLRASKDICPECGTGVEG